MQIEAETRRSPSLDLSEIGRFEALAKEWWDEKGKFRGLHSFNPARIAFIIDEVRRWRSTPDSKFSCLQDLSILDIGCGGGILAEPLARLGANITGIDPVVDSIAIAITHAAKQNLAITYRAATAEDLVREGHIFDVVVASEVIEHVADAPAFLGTCRALCRAGGRLFVSTLNRTSKSYGLAILAAEYVLGLVPRGTHEWKKFIRPEELETMLLAANFKTVRQCGIVFKPLKGSWILSELDLAINYIVAAEAM
jgi:2-polyprenyl-6-hydroxyphenyl methylase / 3-demethylubiquinone-9 3-methyltransferase